MSKPDYLAHLHDTSTYFAVQIMAGNSGKSDTHFENYLSPNKTQNKPMGFSWPNPGRSQAGRNDNGLYNWISGLSMARSSCNGVIHTCSLNANLFANLQQKERLQHE